MVVPQAGSFNPGQARGLLVFANKKAERASVRASKLDGSQPVWQWCHALSLVGGSSVFLKQRVVGPFLPWVYRPPCSARNPGAAFDCAHPDPTVHRPDRINIATPFLVEINASLALVVSVKLEWILLQRTPIGRIIFQPAFNACAQSLYQFAQESISNQVFMDHSPLHFGTGHHLMTTEAAGGTAGQGWLYARASQCAQLVHNLIQSEDEGQSLAMLYLHNHALKLIACLREFRNHRYLL